MYPSGAASVMFIFLCSKAFKSIARELRNGNYRATKAVYFPIKLNEGPFYSINIMLS